MSLFIEKNILRIEIPNSEASINAQHKGIKDRTVGGYYLSNEYDKAYEFLNHLEGNFYIDFLRVYINISPLISKLDEGNLTKAFKNNMLPQKTCLKSIKYLIDHGDSLHKISPPLINENRKYIKLPNDDLVNDFRDLCLGNLTNILIRKMGIDSFLIYVEDNQKLEEYIKTGAIANWIDQYYD